MNQRLADKLKKDSQRVHYEKKKKISDLLQEEQTSFLKLPDIDYPVFKQFEVKPNRYNEVTIDKTRIHIPMAKTMLSLTCVLTATSYTIYDLNGEIVSKGRRPYLTKKRAIEWSSVFITWKRKPRSMTYSRYWKYLPKRIAYYLSTEDWRLQTDRIDELITLLSTHPLKEINERFYELVGISPTSEELSVNMKSYDQLARDRK